MTVLLQTKIQLPPLRGQHIQRQRLLEPLRDNPATRLVLVSAPAGFGKSTCLIQWAHTLQQEGTTVAWYALDERDNDPARFAAYLLEAFRRLAPPFSRFPTGPADIHETLALILNRVTEFEKPVVLIMDDYHLIAEPQIHSVISRMCDYLPPNMRLALGTRADPPLQLARLRALGQVAEIRMAALRFNTAELRAWFEAELQWSPSDSSVEMVQNATEGWAAALSLIMMNQPHADEEMLARQLTRYSQSRRHIFDYFAQEILEQQPADTRRFLLDTAVLDRLTPALCTALTDNPQAPVILDQLAQKSLFVISLSSTEPVYRYHHLFQHFLRHFLEMADRERYLTQHRQAAEWLAAQGSVVDAAHHALAAEDFDYAAALIERRAWPVLSARGEFITLVRWHAHFSQEVLARHPRLWLYFVRALYLTGNVPLAEEQVGHASGALDHYAASVEIGEELQAVALNCQATLAAYRGDVDQGLAFIERVNALHERMEAPDRMQLASAEMLIRYLKGDVPEARRACHRALEMARTGDNLFQTLDAHYYLAQLDILAGDLDAAQARCERLLEQYPSRPAPLIPLMVPLANVLYQRNQLVEAEVWLRDALALAHRANLPDTLLFARIALGELLVARGDADAALSSISQAREFAGYYRSKMLDSLVSAAEARVRLRRGEVDHASFWAAAYQKAAGGGYHQDFEDITLALVWLAQDERERALALLERLVERGARTGRTFYVIQGGLLQAVACHKAHDLNSALAALEPALALGRTHGLVRVFVDVGRSLQPLLQRAVERDVVTDYAAFLLDRAGGPDHLQHPADALTSRELEVLEHIALGASNQEIAEALVIAVGTVKSHVHRLMSKLDAQNRTEAVSKARTLNILPD